MDKTYSPLSETLIYDLWEKSGAFTPTIDHTKTPFTVILPPPNANEPLHAGHALFTVEDILVRFHRMLGDPTLWLPGTDHAGIETQFVFEKKLKKDGKSRFDYDRDTLFQLISDYVNENRTIAKSQLKRLGFSLDWTRERFTLDPAHNHRVFAVFKKMSDDGLVYRDEKIVNYCTRCGTAFSNLEVEHKTVNGHLWYFKYGSVTVATTRPETMLGDTAVAVNPTDPRYQKLIGTKIILPLVGREIPIIAEESVDPKFGTGAVKVTPSHSPEDFDMAKTHDLEFIRIFDYDGKANQNVPEIYHGLFPNQLRTAVIADMESAGLLEKTVDYTHEVGHCYKCGNPIEPITAPQWFVKIQPLADKAIEVVKKDAVKIFPARFKRDYLTWMKGIKDWPISRQIVWGHRIPVWYNLTENPDILITYVDKDKKNVTDYAKNLIAKYSEVASGLQTLLAPIGAKYYLTREEAQKTSELVLQETDTFDTWFSSGQWPYSTLGWEPDGNHSEDFKYFYPTTVLDTMWDILFFWVARMIMMGVYVTGQIPFKVAHMHSRVLDGKGQKMSKSKGNTINPVGIAEAHGADALRLALVIGVAPGSDVALSEDKIRAQRNFVNKIWNASRFVLMFIEKNNKNIFLPLSSKGEVCEADRGILDKLNELIKSTTKNITSYRFGQATDDLYAFFWHDFCDVYIEAIKDRGEDAVPVLLHVLITSLKLIHPFAPFVTEAVYQELLSSPLLVKGGVGGGLGFDEKLLITSLWPHEI
ncbi:valine--tRNA ligase [Candidatus Shapirobacteria bacterium]|nr:valine--tRNA ligase [Candidatus Shapirobacteria bacterium]